MHSLNVTSITCVFDQAIYCKALEIKSKNVDIYKPVVLHLGTFHTLCTLLSIIGERFQDAVLKDYVLNLELSLKALFLPCEKVEAVTKLFESINLHMRHW